MTMNVRIAMREDNSGWIKLSRKILNWGWYSDPNVRAVFIHLLLIANWTDNEYRGYKISRGQAVIGIKALSTQLGISVQQARTALEKLKSTDEIKVESNNKFSIITIENWGKYQGESAERLQHENNTRITNNLSEIQHADNKQITSWDCCNRTDTAIFENENNTPITNEQHADNTPITFHQQTDNNTIRNKEYKNIRNQERKNDYIASKHGMDTDEFMSLSLDDKIAQIRKNADQKNKEWNEKRGNKS